MPAATLLAAGSGPVSPAEQTRLHLLGSRTPAVETAGPAFTLPDETRQERKSVSLAAVASLVLPGAGELYADGFSSGKYFLIAEGALWLTYIAFDVHGTALRDDARAYAISRAGVNPAGKDDQYYVDIGNFLDIQEYNEKQLRDREPDRLYDPGAGYAWRWESDADRALYREQRISAETAFNNRKFVVAAVIINHVASAINAARSAIAWNKAVEEQLGALSLHATVLGFPDRPDGIRLTLTRKF